MKNGFALYADMFTKEIHHLKSAHSAACLVQNLLRLLQAT